MKDCGECSLCCKLLDVPGLAEPGQWCPHCQPGKGGCLIHDDRPEICLGFDCFWRAESWPDWLRPDRSKVIFEALPGVKTILISVETSTPNAWKDGKIIEVIMKLQSKGRPLVLKTIYNTAFFVPKGWTQKGVMDEIKKVIDWKNDCALVHN